MNTYISQQISKMERYNVIDKNQKEIIKFGLRNGISLLLFIGMFVIESFMLEVAKDGLIFLLLFTILRLYAGGFHAKSRTRCFWASLIVMNLFIFNIKYEFLAESHLKIPLILSIFIIYLLAPVVDKNRVLGSKEKIYLRNITYTILTFYIFLYITTKLLELQRINYCITCAIVFSAALVVLGFIKNKRSQISEELYE